MTVCAYKGAERGSRSRRYGKKPQEDEWMSVQVVGVGPRTELEIHGSLARHGRGRIRGLLLLLVDKVVHGQPMLTALILERQDN